MLLRHVACWCGRGLNNAVGVDGQFQALPVHLGTGKKYSDERCNFLCRSRKNMSFFQQTVFFVVYVFSRVNCISTRILATYYHYQYLHVFLYSQFVLPNWLFLYFLLLCTMYIT